VNNATTTTRPASSDVVDWSDLGARMWTFLTGQEAAIHYSFEDMAVEVPRDTGPRSPRATWKLNGTLTITTSDRGNPSASSATPTSSSAGGR